MMKHFPSLCPYLTQDTGHRSDCCVRLCGHRTQDGDMGVIAVWGYVQTQDTGWGQGSDYCVGYVWTQDTGWVHGSDCCVGVGCVEGTMSTSSPQGVEQTAGQLKGCKLSNAHCTV